MHEISRRESLGVLGAGVAGVFAGLGAQHAGPPRRAAGPEPGAGGDDQVGRYHTGTQKFWMRRWLTAVLAGAVSTCSLAETSPPGEPFLAEVVPSLPRPDPSALPAAPFLAEVVPSLPRPDPSALPAAPFLAPFPADGPAGAVPLSPLPDFGRVALRYRPKEPGTAWMPKAVQPAFELILDSSQSMSEPIAKEPKYLIARRVMHDLLRAMPDDAPVGLRLFGHMGFWDRQKESRPDSNKDPRSNTDSNLVVGIGKLDARHRAHLKQWIDSASPSGKTPLVYSLLQARKDFPVESKGPKTIILVSDGKETCGGILADVEKAYAGADIGLVVRVIGFDVAAAEQEHLRAIARSCRGDYYNATDAEQLAGTLREAMASFPFVLHDESGKRVDARGTLNGPAVEVEAGAYRLSIPGTQVATLLVQVGGGRPLTVDLSEDGRLVLNP